VSEQNLRGAGVGAERYRTGSGEVQDGQARQRGGAGRAAGRSGLERDRKRVGPAPCR
jgi:hypothetical protein